MTVLPGNISFEDTGSLIKISTPLRGHVKQQQIESRTTSLVVKDDSGKEIISIPELAGTVNASETAWSIENGHLNITLHKYGTEKWQTLDAKEVPLEKDMQKLTVTPQSTDAAQSTNALQAREQIKQFFEAALKGDLKQLKEMAPASSDESLNDVKDANARTALHFAAQGNQLAVVEYLINEKSMNVNCQDNEGETPVGLAAGLGHDSMVVLLTKKHNADVTLPSDGNAQPLHRAAATGSIGLLTALLEAGADIEAVAGSGTPLIWAAGSGNLNAVNLLLDKGADPNKQLHDGFTAILMASAAGDMQIVQALLAKKADPNKAAVAGVTALHAAAELGELQLVKVLVEAGADCNAKDDLDALPIHAAASSDKEEVVSFLLPKTTPVGNGEWTVSALLAESSLTGSPARSDPDPHPVSRAEGHIADTNQDEKEYDRAKSAQLKREGSKVFLFDKDDEKAVRLYTEALKHNVKDSELWANRAAAYLRLEKVQEALVDARTSRHLDEKNVKAWYREGLALAKLEIWTEAAQAFYEAYSLKPDEKKAAKEFQNAVAEGRKAHIAQQAASKK